MVWGCSSNCCLLPKCWEKAIQSDLCLCVFVMHAHTYSFMFSWSSQPEWTVRPCSLNCMWPLLWYPRNLKSGVPEAWPLQWYPRNWKCGVPEPRNNQVGLCNGRELIRAGLSYWQPVGLMWPIRDSSCSPHAHPGCHCAHRFCCCCSWGLGFLLLSLAFSSYPDCSARGVRCQGGKAGADSHWPGGCLGSQRSGWWTTHLCVSLQPRR